MGKQNKKVNPERQRARFTKEFKLETVRLLDLGQKPATQLALELGVARNQLYKWQAQLQKAGASSAFRGPGRKPLDEQTERERLKRELKHVTEERDMPATDLLNQQFRNQAPDRAWVGDMTFIRTRQGWLHLAVLLDLFSRRIVGWAMGTQPGQTLTQTALTMALAQREPAAGLIHHTDRGSPYGARGYGEQLGARGIRPSMGGRKSAYDNAVAESFFSSLKNELIHHCDFATRDHARAAIFDYIELFYNRKRIHQSLGYRTPEAVERAWYGA